MTKESVLRMADSENHVGINGTKRILGGLVLATAIFLHHNARAQEVNLGTANNFAVLAGSAVTSTGNTVINGDLGLYPGTSVTGFPAGIVNGTMHVTDAVAQQAQNDLTTAYNQAAGLAPTGGNLTGEDLGGLTLTPGVYFFSSSAELTGTLTLNDLGNPDAVFVFQIGSSLTTASGSSVVTENGGDFPGISVFWQVGSSATLGTTTAFEGNILALTSITADTGATDLDGRLLARNGAVTLDDNTITAPPAESVPDTGSTILLLGSALAALIAFERRFSSLA
jgi:hypothetical protein